jgi:5-methylcytosine-specific restriction protein A
LIKEVLIKVSSEYLNEKEKPTKGNELRRWIDQDIPEIFHKVFNDESKLEDFHIKASAGEGNWKNVPWIAILHNRVSMSLNTKNPEQRPPSAKWGYYPVYLFSSNMKRIVLCLSQGETSVREEHSNPKDVDAILKARAIFLRKKLPEYKKNFKEINIVLDEEKSTAKSAERYIIGTAFGKIYNPQDLPSEEELKEDLFNIFDLFSKAIERGGVSEDKTKIIHQEKDSESQGYEQKTSAHIDKEHEYIKTDPKLIRDLKKANDYTCQACGLRFDKVYGEYSVKKDFIEAHHIVPRSITVRRIAPGQKVPVDKNDFAIICANCHRMIHRMMNAQDGKVITLSEFKEKISSEFIEYIKKL